MRPLIFFPLSRCRDNGKKINGRKRHLICDHRGLALLVWVTSADVQDSLVARDMLVRLALLHPEVAIGPDLQLRRPERPRRRRGPPLEPLRRQRRLPGNQPVHLAQGLQVRHVHQRLLQPRPSDVADWKVHPAQACPPNAPAETSRRGRRATSPGRWPGAH
ncbi:transposase [Streptomyces sp. WAC 06783]|uniref:transposase n=1 Tax=Streptomyces sp. WAC 06783 TaxID=2203211 RepID=UPI0037DBF9FE